MRRSLVFCLLLSSIGMWAQNIGEEEKERSDKHLYDANKKLEKDEFVEAEADYRIAISENETNGKANYNLGNAYYENENLTEAFLRYRKAAEVAQSKEEKHRAFHNMGNVFMKNKEYQKAVNSYENALRNNPKDDETRYNYALAKKMLEEAKKNNEDDKNEDNKDQKDKDKENQDKNKEGDDKDEDKDDKDGEDNEDKKDGDEEEEDKQKQNEDKKDKNDEKKPPKEQPSKPQEGQLSPQQLRNLLEAMNNEEKKVLEKINAEKAKGAKVRSEKDW